MQDQNFNTNYPELISQYLNGNASDAEVQELESWVLADPENKAQFLAFKKAWLLAGMKDQKHKIQVDQLWKNTAESIFREEKVVQMKPRQSRRSWLAIAATVALLLVAALWFFQNPGSNQPTIVQTTDQIKSVDLPDGSLVTLNQASSLSFSNNEENGSRNVTLKGDAFFDVARDKAHPFIINAGNVEVEVLGTSFYIDAREGQDQIQVIVKSGSVAVRAGTNETTLAAGDKAVFEKNSTQLSKITNDDPNFDAIVHKTLVFENSKLEQVVFDLNRFYKTDISFANDKLKSCELNATFSNKSLDAVLTIIENTLNGISINKDGGEIVISGSICE